VAVLGLDVLVRLQVCQAGAEVVLEVVGAEVSLQFGVHTPEHTFLLLLELLLNDSYQLGGCVEQSLAGLGGGICLALLVVLEHGVEGDQPVLVLVVDLVLLLGRRL